MLQSVDQAKTHQIMARFRPIAPKPQQPPQSNETPENPSATSAILRARPCRARKRNRPTTDLLLPTAPQRPKSLLPNILPHAATRLLGLSAQHFPRGLSLLGGAHALLPGPAPVEQDLLKKLQEPKVIVPMPVRPVGSSISVGPISILPDKTPVVLKRRPEDVEEEVESEAEPTVISDSNNRVRLANSAYKEMVGQPECPWLEKMMVTSAAASKRINGNVMLDLSESPSELPEGVGGFSCRVKIEWACNGRKSSVHAPCDVIRLHCDSKDYMFTWRIHTAQGFRTNCIA